MNIQTLGKLTCRVVDQLGAGEKPEVVAVLCHGYGAPGTDLVPIAAELLHEFKDLAGRVRFLFPEAPLALDDVGMSGGRAWWPIDLVRLQLAAASGQFRNLSQDRPAGLVACRDMLVQTLHIASEQSGLPLSRFVIGGFSQGAMLATDVCLSLEENVGALVPLSGTLLNEAEWKQRMPIHAGLRVLQSHGVQDPLLPFSAAESLRDLLRESGAEVEFIRFNGGHQIPFEVLQKLGSLLESIAEDH